MQSGINFNFARYLFLVVKRKYTFRHIISICIGITVAWYTRSFVISHIGYLNPILDLLSVTSLAGFISSQIISFIELFPTNFAYNGAPGSGKAVVVSGARPGRANMPVLGATPSVDSAVDETSSNVENRYVPTGKGQYMEKKVELYKYNGSLTGEIVTDTDNVGPLQQALVSYSKQQLDPSVMQEMGESNIRNCNLRISLLEKVEQYFQAKEAGLVPSPETTEAFEKRQARYLRDLSSYNWKGPKIDYNDPYIVRITAKEDLDNIQWNIGMREYVNKALSKENFSGPHGKAHFWKRFLELEAVYSLKHTGYLEYLHKRAQMRKNWYDTLDKKTLDLLLKASKKDRQTEWRSLLEMWLQQDPNNKDIYQKLSQDKINQVFIKRWLTDDNEA